MKKFAEKILDITDDRSMRVLNGKSSKNDHGCPGYSGISKDEIPPSLKTLKVFSADELCLLTDDQFALIYIENDGTKHRKFPTPDQDNTIASAIYFIENHKKLPIDAQEVAAKYLSEALETVSRLEGYEIAWRLQSLLRPLASAIHQSARRSNIVYEKRDTMEHELRKGHGDEEATPKVTFGNRDKKASNNFALVLEDGQKLFPIDTLDNVKKAEAYFDENLVYFPPDVRHKFAAAIRNQLEGIGRVSQSSNIRKYASRALNPYFKNAMQARIQRVSTSHLEKNAETGVVSQIRPQAELLHAYRRLEKIAQEPGADLDKIAQYLHAADKLAGISPKYLPDAFESVFDPSLPKTASATIEYAGEKFPADSLKSIGVGDFPGLLDEDTLTSLQADPVTVFNSLPMPHKDAILQVISSKKK